MLMDGGLGGWVGWTLDPVREACRSESYSWCQTIQGETTPRLALLHSSAA